MRVLVCGGRDFANAALLESLLDQKHSELDFTVLIHRAAVGADTLAGEWAQSRGIDVASCPAQWSVHDPNWCRCSNSRRPHCPSAGARRNAQMLQDAKPDLVIAFPGGNGTADMVRRAEAAGVATCRIGAAD